MHQVQTEVEKIPGVKKAEVEIVWEPPWTPDKMSPEAKKRLEAAQEPVTIEFNPSTFKPRRRAHRQEPRRKDHTDQRSQLSIPGKRRHRQPSGEK